MFQCSSLPLSQFSIPKSNTTYSGFIADITLHNMLILLSFYIDHGLTDFTVDHWNGTLWSRRVWWRQLISWVGRGNLTRRGSCKKGSESG